MNIAIGIILLFSMFGGIGFAIFTVLKKGVQKAEDIENVEKESAQSFLPWNDIRDQVIDLGNNQYRAILKCSSVNYQLKTKEERYHIEENFQRFLNSLGSAITIFIHTREIDNKPFLQKLRADYDKTVEDHPDLFEYAQENYRDMERLNEELGVSRQKDKYIIVHCDEESLNTLASEEDRYMNALSELNSRCYSISEGLANIGIQSTRLDTADIISFLYSVYHREGLHSGDDLASGVFLEEIVGRDQKNMIKVKNMDESNYAEALKEFELKIDRNFIKNSDNEELSGKALLLLEALELLKTAEGKVQVVPDSHVEKEVYEEIEHTLNHTEELNDNEEVLFLSPDEAILSLKSEIVEEDSAKVADKPIALKEEYDEF